MSLQEWSLLRLILAVVGWLLAFPVLLIAALVAGAGNLGFTLPLAMVVLALWFGPAGWLVARWRRHRGRRQAGDAA